MHSFLSAFLGCQGCGTAQLCFIFLFFILFYVMHSYLHSWGAKVAALRSFVLFFYFSFFFMSCILTCIPGVPRLRHCAALFYFFIFILFYVMHSYLHSWGAKVAALRSFLFISFYFFSFLCHAFLPAFLGCQGCGTAQLPAPMSPRYKKGHIHVL
jgi:hypothetical protein